MTFNSYESVMCYCVFIKARTKSLTTSLVVHTKGATGLSSNEISCVFQAEARLAAKRAARAEAREIRMKELERQQKEVPFTVVSVPLSGIVILGRTCECRDTCPPDTPVCPTWLLIGMPCARDFRSRSGRECT